MTTSIIKYKIIVLSWWGEMKKEVIEEDISKWLYQEDNEQPILLVEKYTKGFQIIKNVGFSNQGGLGLHHQGIREPIVQEKR